MQKKKKSIGFGSNSFDTKALLSLWRIFLHNKIGLSLQVIKPPHVINGFRSCKFPSLFFYCNVNFSCSGSMGSSHCWSKTFIPKNMHTVYTTRPKVCTHLTFSSLQYLLFKHSILNVFLVIITFTFLGRLSTRFWTLAMEIYIHLTTWSSGKRPGVHSGALSCWNMSEPLSSSKRNENFTVYKGILYICLL